MIGSKLAIVVPAHNEASRLARTLLDLRRSLPGAEIIVVANACSDATVQIAEECSRHDPLTRVLEVNARIGKGGAVRLGFQVAKRSVVAFIDADGATSGAELRRLFDSMGGADCVVASRWARGSAVKVAQSRWRRLLGRSFNLLVRLLFGLRLTDTQCGAKLIRKVALDGILDDLETAGFAFDVDLLFQLVRHGRTVVELPTVWCDRTGSTVDVWSAGPRMLRAILRLRLQHSPLHVIVPWLDTISNAEIVRCRRTLRVLVRSDDHPSSPKASQLERSVRAAVASLERANWSFVWRYGREVAPTTVAQDNDPTRYERINGSASIASPRRQDRFDCLIELAPRRSYWPRSLSRKPMVIIWEGCHQPARVRSQAIVLDKVPTSSAVLERAIFAAMTAYHAHFVLARDGTWSLLTSANGGDPVFATAAMPTPALSAV